MVEKLSITIALEGGKAIEAQLEGIGAAGKKAFEDIAAAAEKAGGFKNLKPEEVTDKLKTMGVTGKEALDKISGAVASATRMERLVGVVTSIETGFASAVTAAAGLVRALGPIGIAAGAIGTVLVKSMTDAAEAISKADAEAIKMGLTIEKFDTLRQGFEAMGLSGKQVESAMKGIGAAAEKAKLDQVATEIAKIKQEAAAGIGGVGLAQFSKLIETAQGVGKAAEAAKKGLEGFGVSIKSSTQTLPEMIAKMGDTSKGTAAFVEQLRTMPDSANRSALAIDAFKDAGAALVQSLRLGIITEDQFKERLGTLGDASAASANKLTTDWNRLGTTWERLKTTLGATLLVNVPGNLTAALQTINDLLNPAKWSEWGSAAKQAFIDVFLPVGELVVKLAELGTQLAQVSWDAFQAGGIAAVNAIMGALDSLIEKLKSIGSGISDALSGIAAGGGTPGDVGPIPGNARGGLLGGRGSGTSDSNLAWVSRGEHIMPAHAVRQPGVLALLEALRRSGGNLRGALDGMGRFAAGGMVPRFAAGGLVGGMGHLGTVDLRTDHGTVRLMAGTSAVEQLSRLAVTKRITSTGRKPGFIGG